MNSVAIFASGSGSNAQRIIEYFENSNDTKIVIVLSNKSDAYVLKRAQKYNIKSLVFSRDEFYNSNSILNVLTDLKINFIVLAGFLWLVPKNLIQNFPNRIINIHPALLPKYGGKGMYGDHVHKAVIANKDQESGITIHFVNEHYDEGNIIFQAKCDIELGETPESLASKIHQLEHKHFPVVIENLLKKN